MKKRSLSLLLALLMVLSLVMPGTAAFADTVSAETPADASDTSSSGQISLARTG